MPAHSTGRRTVSQVRPYVITRGRVTADGVTFDMLVAAAPAAPRETGTSERRRVLRALGDSYLTVAEVAVALGVPLGTAQVLVADLSDGGDVRLFGTTAGSGSDLSHDEERRRTLVLLGSVIDGIGEL